MENTLSLDVRYICSFNNFHNKNPVLLTLILLNFSFSFSIIVVISSSSYFVTVQMNMIDGSDFD